MMGFHGLISKHITQNHFRDPQYTLPISILYEKGIIYINLFSPLIMAIPEEVPIRETPRSI